MEGDTKPTVVETTTQSRWRSKVVWLSVLSAAALLAKNLGFYEALGLTDATVQTVIDAALALLVGVGILNNPTTKDAF